MHPLKFSLSNQDQEIESQNPAEVFIKDVLCVDLQKMPETFESFTESVSQGTSEFLKLRAQYEILPDTNNEESSTKEVFDYLKVCEIPEGVVQEQKAELDRCLDERKEELMRMREDVNLNGAKMDQREKDLREVHKKFMMEEGEVGELKNKLEVASKENSRIRNLEKVHIGLMDKKKDEIRRSQFLVLIFLQFS